MDIDAFKRDSVRALKHLRIYVQKVLDPNNSMYAISFAQYDVLFENIWDYEEFKELIRNYSAKNKEPFDTVFESKNSGSRD